MEAIRIGLTGPDGVGKTTTAHTLMWYLLSNGIKCRVHSMAIPVYEIAEKLSGVPVDVLRQAKGSELYELSKDKYALELTPRELLRGIGNGLREMVHSDIWLNYMLRETDTWEYDDTVLIFDDIRYSNESAWMDLMIRLERDGVDFDGHQSNRPILDCYIDHVHKINHQEDVAGLCVIVSDFVNSLRAE
jgi:hypothetical protein